MQTAKENLLNLPDQCFGVLPSTNEIIGIVAGESGFRPQYDGFTTRALEMAETDDVEAAVAELNAGIGVTHEQRLAMEHGSMFGFHTPAASVQFWADRPEIAAKLRQKRTFYRNR